MTSVVGFRRDKVVSQVNHDIEAANKYLAEDLQVSLIRQVDAATHPHKHGLGRTSTLRERHSHIDPAALEASMS